MGTRLEFHETDNVGYDTIDGNRRGQQVIPADEAANPVHDLSRPQRLLGNQLQWPPDALARGPQLIQAPPRR
jgi:hypothetical protein